MATQYCDMNDAESLRTQKLIIALDIAVTALGLQPKDDFKKNIKLATDRAHALQEGSATVSALIDEMRDFVIDNVESNRAITSRIRAAAYRAKHDKIAELRRYCADRGAAFKRADVPPNGEQLYDVTLRATQRASDLTIRAGLTLGQAYTDMLAGKLIKD